MGSIVPDDGTHPLLLAVGHNLNMIAPEEAQRILSEIEISPASGVALRREAMERLSELPGYDWSGVYRLEGDALLLDEYVGAETDHVNIPVGVGVCGTAVAERANQVIADVRELDNYLSCSVSTRSEIVTLIEKGGAILGQIDIDGHTVGQFDKSDEEFLMKLGKILADRW